MSDYTGTETAQNEIPLYEKAQKDTVVSKCAGCGADLKFNPDKQGLWCEHCGNVVRFAAAPSRKLPFYMITDEGNKWTDTHVFRCNNCGAKEVLGRNEIAKTCSFCGTTSIVETQELSGLKPNAVLPFRITKESAIQRFIAWAKKKFFAPAKFKKNVRPEEVDGVYNPAFMFDTHTFTRYSGRLGKTEFYTTRQNGQTVTRTRTVYYNISGTYTGSFSDILIQAATQIKQKDVDKLKPFPSTDAMEYNGNFLFGYTANQYEKDGLACWSEARSVIDNLIKRAILGQYEHTSVQSFQADTAYNDLAFSYTLLPVYVGHSAYRKKIYNFYVNGTNGKVVGKTPVSPGKVALVAGILLAVLAGAAIGVTKFLQLW